MVDLLTKRKWDRAAKNFDFMAAKGPELRWANFKKALFSHMEGKVLFLAVGTGLDFPNFPPGQDITGIDISPAMLEKPKDGRKLMKVIWSCWKWTFTICPMKMAVLTRFTPPAPFVPCPIR